MDVTRALRSLPRALCAASTLFLIYVVYAIFQMPPGDGTGMNLVGISLFGFVYLFTILPAFNLSRSDRIGSVLLAVFVAAMSLGISATLWFSVGPTGP